MHAVEESSHSEPAGLAPGPRPAMCPRPGFVLFYRNVSDVKWDETSAGHVSLFEARPGSLGSARGDDTSRQNGTMEDERRTRAQWYFTYVGRNTFQSSVRNLVKFSFRLMETQSSDARTGEQATARVTRPARLTYPQFQ